MARRRRQPDKENLDRWLVSYADFITLLFAFFVVMYAISSVNEGKYRVLSNTLVDAFNTQPRALRPVQLGDEGLEPVTPVIEMEGRIGQPPTDLEAIFDDFTEILPHLEADVLEIRRSEFWVEIEINTSYLFPSGSARLEAEAIPILTRLAEVLGRYPNLVQVEGFTDNVPIQTVAYPSNWELSAARAASVVHLFEDHGVAPERMAAIGYGEHQPVADNATVEGRRKNRRVLVVILADGDARRLLDIQRGAQAGAARQTHNVCEWCKSLKSGRLPQGSGSRAYRDVFTASLISMTYTTPPELYAFILTGAAAAGGAGT